MTCRLIFVCLVAAFCAGCASVSVDRVRPAEAPKKPLSDPKRIYVQNFATPPDVFRVDRGGDAYEKFREDFSQRLTDETARRVDSRLRPSFTMKRGEKRPKETAWLVTGRFERVNQGSRVLRTAVGLGMGATKLETYVAVYDLAHPGAPPILEFVTTGGTNAQPGVFLGLVAPNFWLMGLDAAIRIGPGLNADTIRTSRQIVAVLSEYMAQQGLLPPEKIYRSKKAGKWP